MVEPLVGAKPSVISMPGSGIIQYCGIRLLGIWNLPLLTFEYCFGIVHFVCHSSLYCFFAQTFCFSVY